MNGLTRWLSEVERASSGYREYVDLGDDGFDKIDVGDAATSLRVPPPPAFSGGRFWTS